MRHFCAQIKEFAHSRNESILCAVGLHATSVFQPNANALYRRMRTLHGPSDDLVACLNDERRVFCEGRTSGPRAKGVACLSSSCTDWVRPHNSRPQGTAVLARSTASNTVNQFSFFLRVLHGQLTPSRSSSVHRLAGRSWSYHREE